ncbi:MAG: hypothetical protein KAI51_04450, partial [Candidatus Aenigmarchaeota archaeon]|nr:hypothetical protein [Candidatus Aenigmarchaeota archaeon]
DMLIMPYLEPDSLVTDHTVLYDDNLFFTYEISKYPTSVEISNIEGQNISIGFSLESTSLDFGVVPTGGAIGMRFLTLKNTQDDTAKMLFFAYGNISSMIHYNDNNFHLKPEVTKDIEIMLKTDKNTPVGDYSGEINLVVKRARYNFMKLFL